MIRFSRFLIALSVIAGLVAGRAPALLACGSQGVVKSACHMPCCKTGKIPLGCPMVKAVPAPDVLPMAAPSFDVSLSEALIPAAVVMIRVETRPQRRAETSTAPPPLFLTRLLRSRAPPALV